MSLYTVTLVLAAALLAPATFLSAADKTPTHPTPSPVRPKIMPSTDDVANDVVKHGTEDAKPSEDSIRSSLRESGTATVNGFRYLVFKSSLGTLLVPAAGNKIKNEDFEAALCSQGSTSRTGKNASSLGESRMIVGIERPLSEKYTAYAGMMAHVIRKKCGTTEPTQATTFISEPELGVKWDNGSKSGGHDKVFVQPQKIGFGSSF